MEFPGHMPDSMRRGRLEALQNVRHELHGYCGYQYSSLSPNLGRPRAYVNTETRLQTLIRCKRAMFLCSFSGSFSSSTSARNCGNGMSISMMDMLVGRPKNMLTSLHHESIHDLSSQGLL